MCLDFLAKRIDNAIKNAANIALDYYNRGEKGWLKKDGTWITEADKVIEKFLRCELNAAVDEIHSTIRLFGEEEGWTGPYEAEYIGIIDPIEGTALFAHQIPLWGIAASIFKSKKMLMAGFAMPAIKQFFFAISDRGASLNGNPLVEVAPKPITKDSYLGVSSNAHRWNITGYPGKIRAFGSTSFHILAVTTVVIQAAFLTRFKFYDLVTPALIHKEAGGELIYYPSGKSVNFSDLLKVESSSKPILACQPQQVSEFIKMNFHELEDRRWKGLTTKSCVSFSA